MDKKNKKTITDLLEEYGGNFSAFKEKEGGNYKAKDLETIEKQFKELGKYYGARNNVATAMSAGVENASGNSSLGANPLVHAAVKAFDDKALSGNIKSGRTLKDAQSELTDMTKEAEGKSEEEQKELVKKYYPEYAPKETPIKKAVEQVKSTISKPTAETKKGIEKTERQLDTDEKKNSFLKSWAATHPSWIDILKSKDLSTSQKVQLVLGAMANIGANVTLGAKAGFEHSGFQPIAWDFKNAIDQYTSNEIDNVLSKEQDKRGDELAANYLKEMQGKYGEDKMQSMFELAAKYSDNPAKLEELLKAEGIHANGKEFAKAYGKFRETELKEGEKRERIKTTIDSAAAKLAQINNKIAELDRQGKKVDVDVKKKTEKLLIEAQNAQNYYAQTKYDFDADHYSMERYAGYASNVLGEIEKLAGTVTDVAGAVKDGIIKGKGIPQKVIRADGTEIQLDPNDNIYATKNELTTEKDDGSEVIPMELDDRVVTVQRKLGYTGGFINKDFDYYLNKLRG